MFNGNFEASVMENYKTEEKQLSRILIKQLTRTVDS